MKAKTESFTQLNSEASETGSLRKHQKSSALEKKDTFLFEKKKKKDEEVHEDQQEVRMKLGMLGN